MVALADLNCLGHLVMADWIIVHYVMAGVLNFSVVLSLLTVKKRSILLFGPVLQGSLIIFEFP